ncbi:MAG: hypothetical protein QOG89_972, partial [Thermomicrobiales bacterium]|nr:hypothetical protein [Thermomicrobiales bacterium]
DRGDHRRQDDESAEQPHVIQSSSVRRVAARTGGTWPTTGGPFVDRSEIVDGTPSKYPLPMSRTRGEGLRFGAAEKIAQYAKVSLRLFAVRQVRTLLEDHQFSV